MSDSNASAWADEAEQDVRLYAVTGGRTRPRHTMRLVTLLAVSRASPSDVVAPEAAQVLSLCRNEERSVAELAGLLRLPVQVIKIIISDLIDSGALRILAAPDTTSDPDNTAQTLEAVLAGLRHKWRDVA